MTRTKYMDMVGKYIRMERPATEDEQAAGDPPTIGMECVVDRVEFGAPGWVTICADYGYAFTVTPETEAQWEFTVWSDEAAASAERSRTVPTEHEFALDHDEAESLNDRFEVWRWLCSCGERGNWQAVSGDEAERGWREHVGEGT